MTKPVTATAAMMLVEDGRLRLDDPVDDLLPELANRRVLRSLDGAIDDTVPARRPITVRDLLTFRCGYGMLAAPPGAPIWDAIIEAGFAPGPPQPANDPEPDEWMRRLATLPLAHQPGEQWLYHTGSDILGVLIARASSRTFPEFLRERVFEPLGMVDTGCHVPAADVDRLTTAYFADPGSGSLEIFDPAAGGQWTAPPAFPSGAAGLVSTIDDFHAFSVMLASNGFFRGDRLLSRPSVELMMTDQLTAEQKAVSSMGDGFFDAFGWGFGMAVCTKRVDVETNPGRVGWDGGLGTAWTVDRGETLVTILMTQKLWDSPRPPKVVRDFRTAAYAALDD
jgi:CubicO group peptidase (beta-lactamase class C family)